MWFQSFEGWNGGKGADNYSFEDIAVGACADMLAQVNPYLVLVKRQLLLSPPTFSHCSEQKRKSLKAEEMERVEKDSGLRGREG